MSGIVREKVAHVVLIQGNQTDVRVVLLVKVVKFTALAICGLLFLFGCHTFASLSALHYTIRAHVCQCFREFCADTGQTVKNVVQYS